MAAKVWGAPMVDIAESVQFIWLVGAGFFLWLHHCGEGGFLACGRNLAFGAMVAWANVLEVIYGWFKACQAATQFIASYAGVYAVWPNLYHKFTALGAKTVKVAEHSKQSGCNKPHKQSLKPGGWSGRAAKPIFFAGRQLVLLELLASSVKVSAKFTANGAFQNLAFHAHM